MEKNITKEEFERLKAKIKSGNRYINKLLEKQEKLEEIIENVAVRLEKELDEQKSKPDEEKDVKSMEIAMKWCIKRLRSEI